MKQEKVTLTVKRGCEGACMDSVGGRDKLESSIDLEQTLYVRFRKVKYCLKKDI